ncbi:MAG: polysaccharide biosynthesis/export family protein [Paludibacteraceae bacterium]|nr:polysaccharide biosynthesis/export family protein [Paludibacteraceae bacterium]
MIASCKAPKDITYFQDSRNNQVYADASTGTITVKPGDKISIVVSSKDARLSEMFNLPIAGYRVGQANLPGVTNNTQQISCYSIDNHGDIDFPVLGKIKVAGKMRSEIAEHIKLELIKNGYVSDPIVTVEFSNLYVSVMGEVNKPGRFFIENDRITLLDALSMAGDLTIYGKRENVTVIREEEGQKKFYKVNLTKAKSVYTSPAYYLQQKDVIYVTPNDTRARQSTVNGNNIRSTSFWISLASLAASVAVLIYK